MARFPRILDSSPEPIPSAFEPKWIAAADRLELDLGCARGKFLFEFATLHPEIHILGVERQSDRVLRCARKIERAGLNNARVVKGEIPEVIKEQIPSHSVDFAHILFPDPWPKRKHAIRRLLSAEFLESMERVLKPGGRIRFLTDSQEYWLHARDVFRSQRWTMHTDNAIEAWPRTEFQARFEAQEKPVYGCLAEIDANRSRASS